MGLAATGAAEASTRWPASSLPPGVPASCDSNTRSSPSVPTLAFGRIAGRLIHGSVGLRDRSQCSDYLLGDRGNRRRPIVPLGERRAIARQQGPSGREPHRPSQALARPQAGEQHRGSQLDPRARTAAGERHHQGLVQWTPDLGVDGHLDRDRVAVCAADADRPKRGQRGRRCVRRQLVDESRLGRVPARPGVEQLVHLRVVVVLPGGHVLGHEMALGAAWSGRQHGAGRERRRRQRDHRNPAFEQPPAPRPSPTWAGSARHYDTALDHPNGER